MGPVRQSTNAPSETLTVVAKAKETVHHAVRRLQTKLATCRRIVNQQ